MKTLIIARHGNTFRPGETPTRVGAGTDLPLVEEERARGVGKYLKNKGLIPSKIYAAPLRRTMETARLAAAEGYDYFATTLTLSPLKDPVLINGIGDKMAEKYGVKYLASDFKKDGGYLRSVEISREQGLYRQNYCGCAYSKRIAGGEK